MPIDPVDRLNALVAEQQRQIELLQKERDEARDWTWFWQIVDRGGLNNVCSDERGALAELVRYAAERDDFKRQIEEGEKRVAELNRIRVTYANRLYFRNDTVKQLKAMNSALQARIAELEKERELLKLQAQIWAGEARCHKSTVHEIYQFISGATGEKGNWNGAKPVVEKFTALQSSARQMKEALEKQKWWLSSFKPYGWKDAAEVVDAALQSAASLDLGQDWRKEAEKLSDTAESLSEFAWSAVSADCDESRRYLSELLASLRAAIADFNRAKGGGNEDA